MAITTQTVKTMTGTVTSSSATTTTTLITRGVGPRGVWGGRTPPRIRDLYSKNFENLQNNF